jgi:hypothetical protein
LEARLSILEAKLGYPSSSSILSSSSSSDNDTNDTKNKKKTTVTNMDLSQRLTLAEEVFQQTIVSSLQRSGWDTTWNESDVLLRDLDPGTALSYQVSSSTNANSNSASTTTTTTSFQQPILYRRQQVLAAAESLQQDMHQLSQALQLLQISNSTSTTSTTTTTTTTLREEQVTQAPIVVDIPCMSPETVQRLNQVQLQCSEYRDKCHQIQQRVQRLLEHYHTFIMAASEKLVLANEQLQEYETAKQRQQKSKGKQQ